MNSVFTIMWVIVEFEMVIYNHPTGISSGIATLSCMALKQFDEHDNQALESSIIIHTISWHREECYISTKVTFEVSYQSMHYKMGLCIPITKYGIISQTTRAAPWLKLSMNVRQRPSLGRLVRSRFRQLSNINHSWTASNSKTKVREPQYQMVT